jgi:hypothetical protein
VSLANDPEHLRILLTHPGPEFSVHDVWRGYEKAFRKLGHPVITFNMNHRLMYHGNTYLKDYPEDWDGSRKLPSCEACGQEPFKKALTDEQVTTIVTRQIFEDAFVFWPNVIVFTSGFFYDEAIFEVLRARGMKLAMIHTESPYEDERQMAIGAHMDLNLINDPVNLAAWRAAGLRTHYLPHAYDPEVHYPVTVAEVTQLGDRERKFARSEPYESDFTFIGTGFKSRRDFFGQMDLTGVRWSIGGGGWGEAVTEPANAHLLDYMGHHPELCVDNEETARQYRIAKTSLNLYRREGEDGTDYAGWSMGPREVELAACGTFFIRDPRGEGDELFDGILPTFSSPEEAAELIRHWSKLDSLREERARQAREKILDRTFGNNALKIMGWLEDAGLTV